MHPHRFHRIHQSFKAASSNPFIIFHINYSFIFNLRFFIRYDFTFFIDLNVDNHLVFLSIDLSMGHCMNCLANFLGDSYFHLAIYLKQVILWLFAMLIRFISDFYSQISFNDFNFYFIIDFSIIMYLRIFIILYFEMKHFIHLLHYHASGSRYFFSNCFKPY